MKLSNILWLGLAIVDIAIAAATIALVWTPFGFEHNDIILPGFATLELSITLMFICIIVPVIRRENRADLHDFAH